MVQFFIIWRCSAKMSDRSRIICCCFSISKQGEQPSPDRLAPTEESSSKLARHEGFANAAFTGEKGLLNLVKDYNFHWVIRDQCKMAINNDQDNPALRTVYIFEIALTATSARRTSIRP